MTRVLTEEVISTQGAEQVWQPIETAPRDQEEFLGCRLFDDGSCDFVIAYWSNALERFTAGEPFEEDNPITHWMPLPEPPSKD